MINLFSQMSVDNIFEEGQYIEALEYCKSHYMNGQCQAFYDRLINSEHNDIFITCPKGMSAYICTINGQKRIFTCFREKQTYLKQKSKGISNSKEIKYNPVLDRKQILSLINNEIEYIDKVDNIQNREAIINSISHEVKSLNSQIKEKCDVIFSNFNLDDDQNCIDGNDLSSLYNLIRTIYVSSCMISSRFTLYDYDSSSSNYLKGAQFPCNIYKKFDKIKRVFANYMSKNVRVSITGTSYKIFTAYPSFEFIPLLIIENAIKYSYNDNQVIIAFSEYNNSLDVTVSSFSPYCSAEEIEKLFEKGFRGKNAKRVCEGSGIGLYFVKILCDLHNIELSITSDRRRISNINGIPYAPFQIKLSFV